MNIQIKPELEEIIPAQIATGRYTNPEDVISKALKLLLESNMGRSYENIRVDLRGIPLDGYVILDRVINGGIEIVRVVSGYRNLESLFTESIDD